MFFGRLKPGPGSESGALRRAKGRTPWRVEMDRVGLEILLVQNIQNGTLHSGHSISPSSLNHQKMECPILWLKNVQLDQLANQVYDVFAHCWVGRFQSWWCSANWDDSPYDIWGVETTNDFTVLPLRDNSIGKESRNLQCHFAKYEAVGCFHPRVPAASWLSSTGGCSPSNLMWIQPFSRSAKPPTQHIMCGIHRKMNA